MKAIGFLVGLQSRHLYVNVLEIQVRRGNSGPMFAVRSIFVSKPERMRSPDILAISCEEFENEKNMSSLSSFHIKRRRKLQKYSN